MSGKSRIESLIVVLLGTLVGVAAVLLSGVLLGFPLKWCWNYVIPHITNGAVSEIGFWHAIAMWVLFSMLLKPSTSSAKRR